MKYFFVIAQYKDDRQRIFDEVISPRNQKYCDKHGYKYIVIDNNYPLAPFRGSLTWHKILVIQNLLDAGTLKDGDIITNYDADCLFVKDSDVLEPPDGKSLALAVDSGNTFCFGWTTWRINAWSRRLIKDILSDELWTQYVNQLTVHEGFPNRPPSSFALEFREQAMFYKLYGITRHSSVPFKQKPAMGVNETGEQRYDTVDFHKNVHVFDQQYNCTIWPGESDTTFYINKLSHPEEVYVRHLTGCDWNNYKNWI